MRIVATVPDLSGNVMGRAFSIWLLTQHLDWDLTVTGSGRRNLWEPLRGHPFADVVVPIERLDDSVRRSTDVVIAIKPLIQSLSLARRLAGKRRPVVVDIDDPDLEVAIERVGFGRGSRFSSPHRLLKGGHPIQLRRVRSQLSNHLRSVSNPQLQHVYGGVVIPHVRVPSPTPRAVTRLRTIGFVGTSRPHKGLHILREAVALARSHRELDLYVTDHPPRDAQPWETWTGPQPLIALDQTLRNIDVSAVPSLDEGYGRTQLPVKLIDALARGIPTIGSDLAPIRWCAADAASLVPPGDANALADGLLRLADAPEETARRARVGHDRARGDFSPRGVAPVFADLMHRAVRAHGSQARRP